MEPFSVRESLSNLYKLQEEAAKSKTKEFKRISTSPCDEKEEKCKKCPTTPCVEKEEKSKKVTASPAKEKEVKSRNVAVSPCKEKEEKSKKIDTTPRQEKEEKSNERQKAEEHHPDEGETQLSLEEAPTQKKTKGKTPPKESDKALMKSSSRPLATDTTANSGTGGNEKKSEGSLPTKDRKALASARLKKLIAGANSRKQELRREDVKKEGKDSIRDSVRSKFKSVRQKFSRLSGKESKREEPKKNSDNSTDTSKRAHFLHTLAPLFLSLTPHRRSAPKVMEKVTQYVEVEYIDRMQPRRIIGVGLKRTPC
ncbi:hypothetical protein ANCCAN_09388 [Ancylostoma caninum]|uniref:Uncharacterized protein n=1 Tax=Ancylostoma caninum TaxID=29170 RepID=A0A368GLV3_ANCCA|nr:hypothetical protein ANCCAN_09388 [Ancylostoma caninum]